MSALNENIGSADDLFARFGSPVNVHHLGPFGDNLREYESVFRDRGLDHQIYFARKANKCSAFVHEARRLGFGVDTASHRELSECLEAGCDPQNLVLTAAIKGQELMGLAIERDVPIMLDNADECALANRLAAAAGKQVAVGVRISGFTVGGQKLYSRFGFDVDGVVEWILDGFTAFDHLQFAGFHFHLDGYSRTQRAESMLATVTLADELESHGVDTSFIDMGGGFLVNYLESGEQWDDFFDNLRDAVAGHREPITFGNNGLGYRADQDGVQGSPAVYPYYNETPRAIFLSEVLDHSTDGGQTVADMLRRRDLEVRIEPGRSVLDQCGITLARVAHRKRDSRGDLLVGLEMNRTQMFSSSADYLLDPKVVYRNRVDADDEPVEVYFTGAFCLEQDVLLKRKLLVPRTPAIGDAICFPNTAGYMMHFYESEAHLFDLATNVVATQVEGEPRFVEDGLAFSKYPSDRPRS
jgi:diaminopimelate decarboxylase